MVTMTVATSLTNNWLRVVRYLFSLIELVTALTLTLVLPQP